MIHSVDHGGVPLVLFQAAQTGAREVAFEIGTLLVAVFAEFEKALPHRGDVGLVRGNRLAEFDRDRIRKPARPFEKILPAFKGKDGAPQTIEPHRHDGCIRRARDEFVAALEPQELARAREFALGENADDLAALDRFARGLHRVLRTLRGDGQRAHRAEDPVQPAQVENFLPHDETNRPRTRDLEHDRVHPSEVIREKQKAALRQAFAMECGDAVNDRREQQSGRADEGFEQAGFRRGFHGRAR